MFCFVFCCYLVFYYSLGIINLAIARTTPLEIKIHRERIWVNGCDPRAYAIRNAQKYRHRTTLARERNPH